MEYPIERNLDGIYFRVERNEKWVNRCFSDLTKEEQAKVLASKDEKYLQSMIDILSSTIRNIGDQLDLYME